MDSITKNRGVFYGILEKVTVEKMNSVVYNFHYIF